MIGTSEQLRRKVSAFQSPALKPSLWQITNSFGGFLATCAAMYALYDLSYWAALAIAPIAAGFLVRIFIIQHDCGHRAFFVSRRANDTIGFICSLFTLTPYAAWRRQHAGHHGVWNDLDRRQSGADIYSVCLTVEEYQALPTPKRWWYRATRHPLFANVLLPPFVFLLLYRVPFDMPKSWRTERRMVHVTNLVLVLIFTGLGMLLGFDHLAGVQIPVIAIAAIIGVGLFAIQHRGEAILWSRHQVWDPVVAAVRSTNHFRLPRILQWFTGNIGFHQVHHLNPRVPNYRLEACQQEIAASMHDVPTLTLPGSIHCLSYVLWDEQNQRMVTIGASERDRDISPDRTTPAPRHRAP